MSLLALGQRRGALGTQELLIARLGRLEGRLDVVVLLARHRILLQQAPVTLRLAPRIPQTHARLLDARIAHAQVVLRGRHPDRRGAAPRPLQTHRLVTHTDARLRTAQVEVVLARDILPVALAQSTDARLQKRRVGTYLRTLRQVQRRNQTVVQYRARILRTLKLQPQLLAPQLVARDVVLQHRALLAPRPHRLQHLLRQRQILAQHADAVVDLVEVKVVAQQQETYILTVALK